MEELTKALTALNTLCEAVNKLYGRNLSVSDWVFGYIVFDGDNKVNDGNFLDMAKFISEQRNGEG